ncbi:hypothetical protein ACFLU8_05585 [Chloroflexota bacterium]
MEMVSEAQLAANTANAQKGGARTDEGKASVRLNAVTHGLTSKEVLLRGEDGETLDTLRHHLMSELQPQGELETMLADLIVSDTWRLSRAIRMETGYLQTATDWWAYRLKSATPEALEKLGVESVDWAPWKMAIVHDMAEDGALSKMERYRTAIERHLYRSIHELRILQQV